MLGKTGLREVAQQNLAKAAYARQAIAALDGFSIPFASPTFNEFVVESEQPVTALLQRLERQGILGGIALARWFAEMSYNFV